MNCGQEGVKNMLARFCIVSLCVPFAVAQEYRSTISGSVTDPQGAAIPKAAILLIERSTGSRFKADSGETGQYTLTLIPPGQYELTVEAPAFKKYLRGGVTVSTNQRIVLNIAMELGSVQETISITAAAPLVETGTASVGQVITTNQVENMPINGRTPMALAQLAFGVTPAGGGTRIRPYDNSGPTDIAMGGSQNRGNEVLLDGSPDMTRDRRVAYSPPIDAVSEVKVEVFQSDAAYGNTSGGTISVVMKNGTNDLHGTAYEFNQNDKLAARPFFGERPTRRWNQYGVTASGPIFIPKLVNLRNRVFWFFAYEGIRSNEPEVLTSTVPTDRMRRGDFGELLSLPQCGSSDAACRIYDPATGVREGSGIRRQSFERNVIPTNRLNPIALNYMQFYPLPNRPQLLQGNYVMNAKRADTFESYLGRLDWNVGDRLKLFWNYRFNDRLEERSNRFNNIATGNFLGRVNNGSVLDAVYTITPSLLTNFRFNWTRFTESNVRPSDGFDPAKLGFPAYLASSTTRRLLPFIDLDQHQDLSDSGGNTTPFDTFQLFGTVTKVTGRHSIKAGTDMRELRESAANYGNSVGRYRFTDAWTRGPLNTSPGAPVGQSLASFMLGLPVNDSSNSNYEVNSYRTQSARFYSLFLQDDWRVNSALTLNAGLRFERETGTVERFNRTLIDFDPNAVNAVSEAARAAYARSPNALLPASQFNPRGGVVFATPENRNIYSTDNAWAPRFGFAWSPAAKDAAKMAIRGGFGLFYSTIGTQGVNQPGFNARTPLVATLDNYLTPNVTLSDPFPQGIRQPVGSKDGTNTFLGQNVTVYNHDQAAPYTMRWNLNIQRTFGRNFVLEAGYLGSRALHLFETRDSTASDINVNSIPAQYLSRSLLRDNSTIQRLGAIVPNPFQGLLTDTALDGSTIALSQLLRPYPQFSGDSGVRIQGLNNAYSNYHALMIRLERRYASGLQLTTNFTWSKLMEATRRLNESIPTLEYRIANEDRTRRFVFGGNYDLPFGKGKKFGSGAGRALDVLIGGWSMNGILTLQSGQPISWDDRNIIYYGGNLNTNGHNGGLDRSVFNPTPFERNSTLQLSNNIRWFPTRFNDVRQDYLNNIDFSVIKNFQVTERVSAQLRGESFNLTNRPVFGGPETSPTNQNFGRATGQDNQPRSIQIGLRLKW